MIEYFMCWASEVWILYGTLSGETQDDKNYHENNDFKRIEIADVLNFKSIKIIRSLRIPFIFHELTDVEYLPIHPEQNYSIDGSKE